MSPSCDFSSICFPNSRENRIFVQEFTYHSSVMKHKSRQKALVAAAVLVLAMAGVGYYFLFSSIVKGDQTAYLYIDNDDTADSVYTKMEPLVASHGMKAFRMLAGFTGFEQHIHTGRYAIKPGMGALSAFRHIKNGQQEPVKLTIPPVRTLDRLAAEVSKKLMIDSLELYKALTNEQVCRKLGYDTATIVCLFIPDTYDVYWNTPVDKFMERMKKESEKFWTDDRQEKARQMKMTPEQVMTLASIVDEETANDGEKPMIAGMYYNRLMLRNAEYPNGMPLQADPTVKFAMKRFELKRIYQDMLRYPSPYNTYVNTGLPPGPIRIASIAGIDAVLNHTKHNYLYMCAKEDFSGTHNFAATYQEHLQNAARYAKALNERGIK